ncbi:MAG TPA: GNVR domain-containing protein, partial [Candidatus Hydrogenedentes bacterium]|nr:GNVR domain-containing protein [Candidatus Hydrogenedentota bacterium]
TYESIAKVQLLRGRETLQTTTPLVDSSTTPLISMTEEDLNSEIQIIYSDDVLRAVVEEVKLADQGFGGGGSGARAIVSGARDAVNGLQVMLGLRKKPDAVEGAVEALRGAIAVNAIKDSYTMEIRCRMGAPDRASEVLTSLLKHYKAKHDEVFRTPESATEVLELKLDEARAEWVATQEALKQFRETNNVYGLEDERKILIEQYTKAKNLATQLAEIGTVSPDAVEKSDDSTIMAQLSRETESSVITELRLRLLELLLRRNEQVTSKGPNHPDVIGVNKQIEQAVNRLNDAITNAVASSQKQISELETRLKALNSVIDQHDALQEEATIKQDSYTSFASGVQQARVNSQLSLAGINNIVVVSSPSLPSNPIRPRKMFNLLLGFIGGLVGAIGLAFFLDYLDHGLKTPEDIEHYLGVPPVGSFFKASGGKLDAGEAQRVGAIIDALSADQPLQLIQVTSSVPGENASAVARGLAEVFADDPAGPTLLIDLVGDGIKEAPSGRGLFDLVLNGGGNLEEYVANVGALYVMGKGSKKDCPTYMWKSERMKNLINELRARFTRVVIHVSPVLSSGDAVNLARLADGIVVAVKADSTRREVVMRAIELLAESKGRV